MQQRAKWWYMLFFCQPVRNLHGNEFTTQYVYLLGGRSAAGSG